MPLVVNVLETLDMAYLDKEEQEVEMELLKEENEQLVTQYEREKANRRDAESKLLDSEDHSDSVQRQQSDKIESLESIMRMLELKAKNSSDHGVCNKYNQYNYLLEAEWSPCSQPHGGEGGGVKGRVRPAARAVHRPLQDAHRLHGAEQVSHGQREVRHHAAERHQRRPGRQEEVCCISLLT